MALPTENQLNFARSIIDTLNLEVENKLLDDKNSVSDFIKTYKTQYYAALNNKPDLRRDFIIENLPLPKFLDLLGYQVVKNKTCPTYPVYDTPNGTDRVTCHLNTPKKDSKIQSNFFTFFMVKNTGEPPQFEIKGIQKQNQKRAYKETESAGGTIVDFVLKRTLDYSYNDIMNMLEDIAKSDSNIEKYGFSISKIAGKNYHINPAQISQDNFNIWLESYQKIKEIPKDEMITKNARGLNFSDDIKNMMAISDRIKISRVRTQYDEFFGAIFQRSFSKSSRKLISEHEEMPPNNSLYELSCPICLISKDKENNARFHLVGDQRINIICNDFFDKVRENIALTKQKNVGFSVRELKYEPQDVINLVEKLSKMPIPNDLKNDESIATMAKMLLTKNKTTKEYELITDQKKTRFGTQRGVSIFGVSPQETQNERTMLIVENPILDGFSAIKLGYFDKNKTAIFGTIGHPSQDFYNSMKAFIFARHKHYNNIAIATDNDEAGEKFYDEIKQKFFEIYKELFSKIVTSATILGQIHSFDELKFHANNILSKNLVKTQTAQELMQSIADIQILRSIPDRDFKDFNEELIYKNSNSESIKNNNDISCAKPKI